jgi:serine/threonine protein kinase
VPRSIRQSFRRTSDPTGRTVPNSLRIEKAIDLIPLLPARLPRFREGQDVRGTDLRLVELLGIGGFGEVWKARNYRVAGLPPVALKFCLDAAARDRLLQHEAAVLSQIMAQGVHTGIVQLQATCLSADPPWLQYEYVEGGDLGGLIADYKAHGWMDPIWSAKVIQHLARTVGFMHRLRPPVVHRDLKPANILVRRDKHNQLHLKVTDFGIGAVIAERALRDYTTRPTSYGEKLTVGLRGAYTPLYASPQQQSGAPPDARDDVHALGVIWFQLLVADAGLMAIPTDWREVLQKRGVSEGMVQFLGACIASTAESRPGDAMQLAERVTLLLEPHASQSTETGQQPFDDPFDVAQRSNAYRVNCVLERRPKRMTELRNEAGCIRGPHKHMRALIAAGYVEATADGRYGLTAAGEKRKAACQPPLPAAVVGTVSGMGARYPDGLEQLCITVPRIDSHVLPAREGKGVPVTLLIAGESYQADLSAAANRDHVWIGPSLTDASGRRMRLAQVLDDAGIEKSESVHLWVSGNVVTVEPERKAGGRTHELVLCHTCNFG